MNNFLLKKSFSVFISSVLCLGVSIVSIYLPSTNDISINSVAAEESIESTYSVLSECSFQDIKATESYLLNKSYDSNTTAIDIDEDGTINILDMIKLKSKYNQEGNLYDLADNMFANKTESIIHNKNTGNNSVITSISTDVTVVSNILIVIGKESIDFKEFNYKKLLKGPNNVYFLEFDNMIQTESALEILKNNPSVLAVDYDYIYNVSKESYEEDSQSTIFSQNIDSIIPDIDINEYKSWGAYSLGFNEYAKYIAQNTNSNIKVAVLDTGFDMSHPLLKDKLIEGYDCAEYDNNPSYIPYSGNDDSIIRRVSHGTHVSGIILDCCKYTDVKVVPLKIMDANYTLTDDGIINALNYAKDHGCKVINCSFSTSIGINVTQDALMKELVKSGITIVAASGNERRSGLLFPLEYSADTSNKSPCNLKECIVVSAMNSANEVANFSCYGDSVDVTAPGVHVYSSIPVQYGSYAYMDGTSMAAPHISAAAALIQAQFPTYSPEQIEKTLKSTCKDIGTAGWDKYSGYGLPKLNTLISTQVTPVIPDNPTPSINPTITLSTNNAILYKGEKITLYANTTPANITVSWKSSNSSIASVSNGVVTASGNGTATITASFNYNGKYISSTCEITVKNPSISFDKTSESIYQTDSFTINATVVPSNSIIAWSSSNSNVATVSSGKVTAKNPGTATITATFTYNGKTYTESCLVTVKEVRLTLDQTDKTVYQTDEFKLNATSSPSNLIVNWSSSDTSVATVSFGKVTAKNPGTATITASITYGGQTVSSSATVIVKKVSVNLSTSSKSLLVGDTSFISATTSPSDLSIIWSSENNMIASVSSGKITANATGIVDIKATIVYNGNEFTDICNVSVIEPSIELSNNQIKLMRNETFVISAKTLPDNQVIVWKSDDISICSIDSEGKVTAIESGTTVIHASINYAGKEYSDKCIVFVGEPVLTLDKTSMTMYVSDTQSLVAKVSSNSEISSLPIETRSDIKWSSSNTSVATVGSNGNVNALSSGKTTITAKYTFMEKTYSADCEVTVVGKPGVIVKPSSLSLYIGDTYSLSTTATPTNSTISWESDKTNVVSVSSAGKLTAVSSGEATVTAMIRYNGVNYYSDCKVTVIKPSITFNTTNKTVYQGDSFTITPTVKPSGQNISWTSSNTAVAAVSSGKVTTSSVGTATITGKFTYAGNSYSATCKVTVNAISLTLSSYSNSIYSNVWDDNVYCNYDLGIINQFAHKEVLPTVQCTPSNASYSWNIVSGNGWIGGNQNLYASKQSGTVIARCTMNYNGFTTYKDYVFTLQWYKTTTALNYFYKTSNNPYASSQNRYNFNVPTNTTVYISEIVVNGEPGVDGTTIYGRTTYNGCDGWIIISAWGPNVS